MKAKYSQATGGLYPYNACKEFPEDAIDIDEALYARFLSGEISAFTVVSGGVMEAQSAGLSADEIIIARTYSVQSHIDSIARSLGYDNIYTACTYADEPAVPKFQIEGRALRSWRSLVWSKCHEIMDSGLTEIPSEEELIALLPEFKL